MAGEQSDYQVSDRESQPLKTTISIDDEPLVGIVTAVADATNQEPLELTPIAEFIDPDALKQLFAGASACSVDLKVSFTYAGANVTVTETGYIQVTPTQ